jgi:hypothetical protein
MKKFTALLAILLQLYPVIAFTALTDSDKAYIVGHNYLNNPGFENGTSGTTSTASGSFGLTTTAHSGKTAMLWTTTTSGKTLTLPPITYAQNTSLGGINSALYCYLQTSATNYSVAVTDGTNTLNTQTVAASSGFQRIGNPLTFVAPNASGTNTIDIVFTSGSGTNTLAIDDCYVGDTTALVGTVAQAIALGSVRYAATSGCYWATANTVGLTAYGANASCPASVAVGSVLSPTTKIPAAQIPWQGNGRYTLHVKAFFYNGHASATDNRYGFSDGTNTSIDVSRISLPSSTGVDEIYGHFDYPAQTTPTLSGGYFTVQVIGYGSTYTDSNYIYADATAFVLTVDYTPSSAQQVLNASTSPANWSGSSTLSATTTSTSVADITTSLSGSVTTLGTPQNITCVAAASQLGVTCTLPSAGTYHVCYSGTADDGSAGPGISSLLTDGSNVAITGSQLLSSVGTSALTSFGQCGNYPASSTTATFKLRGFVGSGTGTYNLNTISVVSLNTPIAAPIINNSITTNAAGAWRVESVNFGGAASGGYPTSACTSSPCVIASQSGSWVTSVTRVSAGEYAVNFAAGMFSATPMCTCTAGIGAVTSTEACGPGTPAPSPSSYTVYTLGSVDNGLVVMCMGPR